MTDTMPLHVDAERGARLDHALDGLLAAEPYLAYANFAPIAGRDGALARLHRSWWHACAEGEGALVARDRDDRPVAALRLARRDFESGHFGLRMAMAHPPLAVAAEPERLAALRALYAAACATLRERGYQHLAAISSTHDRMACWVLQELGCFHVGTRISWMAPLTGEAEDLGLAPNLRVETYERPTRTTLDPRSWRRLHEWSATAFDRGPFVFDLTVPLERAGGVYQVWTEKAFTGEWADVLIVVRDGDDVVAFHAIKLLPDLSEAAGVGVLGRGIGASLPGYPGLFTALQRECAASRPLGAGFLENETQAATIQTINVFGKLAQRCLRSVATFHRRLDAPMRPAGTDEGGR